MNLKTGEVEIINGEGEVRRVPKSFLRNVSLMAQHGWRENIKSPMQELTINKEKLQMSDRENTVDDIFQDVTNKEEKRGPGRPTTKKD